MSYDNPKYFNAWVKIMENKPKRLLYTYGCGKELKYSRQKIKDICIKRNMKTEMKKILTETNEKAFLLLSNAYLLKLQEANNFVTYLKYIY